MAGDQLVNRMRATVKEIEAEAAEIGLLVYVFHPHSEKRLCHFLSDIVLVLFFSCFL